MIDIMIDLETAGLTPDGAILSIGAVKVGLDQQTLGETFYMNVDMQSCLDKGMHAKGSVFEFWMRQPEEARARLFDPKPVHLHFMLTAFGSWVYRDTGKNIRVWGNGVNFDIGILRSAYEYSNVKVPWHFREERDMRTLVMVGKGKGIPMPKVDREGPKHDALSDALYQARIIMHMWKHLGQRI